MSLRCGMGWSSIGKRGLLFLFLLPTTILLLFALPIVAQAQELRLQFSPSTTTIKFTLGDVFHTVHGSFNLKDGDVQYDSATGAVSGRLVADATSGQSGNHIRDHKMHGEILESKRYPEIVFRPDHVEGKVGNSGISTLEVHGVFSIHGADHELTMPVRVQMFSDHWTADTNFTIPYVKWGIKNPSSLLLRVSESVGIEVHATGASPITSMGGR